MLGTVGIIVLVVIAGILVFASTRPDTMRVERKLSVKAPPERIASFITDFHKWALWSPYERLDPAMKKTFSGAESGQGAVYEWSGNNKVGEGRMELIDAAVPTRTAVKLQFKRPMKSEGVSEFLLVPRGDMTDVTDVTDVTWAMTGPSQFMAKLIGVFMNMDDLIGRDFAVGLENLKRVAEG
jgi:hypothetical protein